MPLTWLLPIRLAQHALDVVSACRLERRDHGPAGLPAQPGGVSGPVRVRRGVSALPHGLPLAGRVPLPGVRRRQQLPSGDPRSAAVPAVTEVWRRHALTAPGCPCHSGLPPTWSPPTRRGSRRCSCSASSGSPATRRLGRCCRSCGERWCDPSATGFRAPSSWTRPMSVGRGRAAQRPAARQQEGDPGRRGRGQRPRLGTDQWASLSQVGTALGEAKLNIMRKCTLCIAPKCSL